MGNFKFKRTQSMTTAWTYTAPTDKSCWADMKTYTDDACTAGEATTVVAATAKAEELTATGTKKYYVVSCAALKMSVYESTDADTAAAKTAYDGDNTLAKDVEYTVAAGGAASGCTAWPKGATDLFAKFTASGYAAPADANSTNSTNATGAKTLAAAFTAGALAVAATQF